MIPPVDIPWESIVQDRIDGLSWSAISKKHNINFRTLYRRRGEMDTYTDHPIPNATPGMKASEIPWSEIRGDFLEGMSWSAISRKYGISQKILICRKDEINPPAPDYLVEAYYGKE